MNPVTYSQMQGIHDVRWLTLFITFQLGLWGCVNSFPVHPTEVPPDSSLVFGRIASDLSGPSNRRYQPEIRFFEITNSQTKERYRVDVEAKDSSFYLPLPDGEYEVTRIQIQEGVFRAMAHLSLKFHIEKKGIYDLGVWDIQVSSPFYDRRMTFSVSSHSDSSEGVSLGDYPELSHLPITSLSLNPDVFEARLFEVVPYPRFRYFMRHHTS